MTSYNPFGWSTTIAASRETLTKRDKDGKSGPTGAAVFQYVVLRFVLGVDMSLIFELFGAFVLSQLDYEGYDFQTHKKAKALVFIGSIGGLAIGVVLILIDSLLSGNINVNGTGKRKKDAKEVSKNYDARDSAIAQCLLRIFLWPGLGAMAGVVGTQLWHLSQNEKPQPKAKYRSSTGAVVQLVGAAVTVAAPSVIQFILFAVQGFYGSQKKD